MDADNPDPLQTFNPSSDQIYNTVGTNTTILGGYSVACDQTFLSEANHILGAYIAPQVSSTQSGTIMFYVPRTEWSNWDGKSDSQSPQRDLARMFPSAITDNEQSGIFTGLAWTRSDVTIPELMVYGSALVDVGVRYPPMSLALSLDGKLPSGFTLYFPVNYVPTDLAVKFTQTAVALSPPFFGWSHVWMFLLYIVLSNGGGVSYPFGLGSTSSVTLESLCAQLQALGYNVTPLSIAALSAGSSAGPAGILVAIRARQPGGPDDSTAISIYAASVARIAGSKGVFSYSAPVVKGSQFSVTLSLSVLMKGIPTLKTYVGVGTDGAKARSGAAEAAVTALLAIGA